MRQSHIYLVLNLILIVSISIGIILGWLLATYFLYNDISYIEQQVIFVEWVYTDIAGNGFYNISDGETMTLVECIDRVNQNQLSTREGIQTVIRIGTCLKDT